MQHVSCDALIVGIIQQYLSESYSCQVLLLVFFYILGHYGVLFVISVIVRFRNGTKVVLTFWHHRS